MYCNMFLLFVKRLDCSKYLCVQKDGRTDARARMRSI